MEKQISKSLIIGYCKCAKCGWTDNKFNWHTYFKCPECGCTEYSKDYYNEQKSKEITNDSDMLAISNSCWSSDLRRLRK